MPDNKITPSDILGLADEAVNGSRNETHGSAEDSFRRISRLWSAYLSVDVSPREVTEMMILLKIARSRSGSYNVDDFVDIAGYAAIGALVDDF